jgi:hypothetical protein
VNCVRLSAHIPAPFSVTIGSTHTPVLHTWVRKFSIVSVVPPPIIIGLGFVPFTPGAIQVRRSEVGAV